MKRYEGLFILNTSGKEESVKEIVDRITKEITTLGGTVETVQKMDKRAFARVANKRHSSGFYVNIIFQAPPTAIDPLRARFVLDDEVFRVMFTLAPAEATPAVAAAA